MAQHKSLPELLHIFNEKECATAAIGTEISTTTRAKDRTLGVTFEMNSLLHLPDDVFVDICRHLPSVEDVLALQTSHPVLHKRINRVFWGSPKGLSIGADNSTNLIIEDSCKLRIQNPTQEKMTAVLSKTRNLREIYLSRDDKRASNETIEKTLCFIQGQGSIRLQKIVAMYNRPELFCRSDKAAWPNKKIHYQLCDLIKSSGKSLLFFGLGLDNKDDFVSIYRPSLSESRIQIEYNHESTWDSRLNVFYPLLSSFATACPAAKVLNIHLRTTPSLAHILLDHCVLSCASAHRSNKLEHISVRFTLKDGKFDPDTLCFENFQNVRNLRTLVWSFDMQIPEDKIEKICRPIGPCPYDIFVDTPKLKKTFPGIHSQEKISNSSLLRCIS
ncbi:hypothetical protein FO519_005027 [Halicephalobus sp. NKZ332]|nr:hypothetical protein FO519_005027 [Halicephalobus sp. NKZ332]